MPMKKVLFDLKKNNPIKNCFTGVPATDMRLCFNRSTWSPAVNMQQPPLGTSHMILGDSPVSVLQNLRISWITTVIAFRGATVAHLYQMVRLMDPSRIIDLMILIDTAEGEWKAMLVCLLPAVWSAAARRHNEKDVKWNK